jgi:hypothetical protein
LVVNEFEPWSGQTRPEFVIILYIFDFVSF